MREGVWTSMVTPVAAAAGATLVAPALLGFGDPGGAPAVLGLASLGIACGGGLLMARLHRRAHLRLQESLNRSARMAAELHQLKPIQWTDDFVTPLVASLNGCLAAAGDVADAAEADSRRSAIEVKLLHMQRRHLEGVLGGLEDAVIVTDAFDEIVMLNAAAGRLFGADDEKARGKALASIVTEGRLSNVVREVRESHSISRRTEELELAPPGEEASSARHYRISLSCLAAIPQRDQPDIQSLPASERSTGVVTVLRDTTREKELAKQKNDFVSCVTHELRTPLASIRAYTEMLVDDDTGSETERKEFCEIIQSEAERLATMIDNILNISRIESGLVKINRRPMSPVMVAEKALDVIEPQAKLKNIEIRRELLPAIFQVIADADLLYQVVLNLLSNAIKYTPDGGRVTLRCEAEEERGMIVTKVIDNGAGIPAEDMPKMFQKFFRVEKNSKMAKGTGLGLPLVKRVIEQDFGGKVWVESVEGQGSTFAFELPMAGRSSKTQAPAAKSDSASAARQRAAA